MERIGITRLLAISVILCVFLATSTSPSPTPTPATPPAPINSKVYRCGEGCARKCMSLAEVSEDKFTNCTVGCVEPCVRSLVDNVYKCTIGCTQTLSTKLSTSSMNEVEGHMATCYNGCNKDFQLSQSGEKALQKYRKLIENNIRP